MVTTKVLTIDRQSIYTVKHSKRFKYQLTPENAQMRNTELIITQNERVLISHILNVP